jgi:hypothetical protein
MALRRSRHLPLLAVLCSVALAPPAAADAASSTTLRGTLQVLGPADFVVQTPGKARGVVAALVSAANRLAAKKYPYVWGGGHAQVGVASVGSKGPGHNGRRRGYDCSGSVAAVLTGANLWPAGSSVPGDAGVISQLRAWHLIAPGAGHGAVSATLYDDPGVHIFMNIGGRFFGTSAGGGAGNTKGGPGWLDGSTPDAFSHTYKRYHFRSAVLHSRVQGQSVGFRTGTLASMLQQFQVGEPISVSYRTSRYGTLVATSIAYPGAITLSGSVSAVAPDGSSLTVQPASGTAITLSTGTLSSLVLNSAAVGDAVTVTYSVAGGTDTLRTIAVTPPPSA